MNLPIIPHATVTLNAYNGMVIQMNEGYVFYDLNDYSDLTDEEGNPREPYPEELSYFRYGVYPRSISNEELESRIVVVAEADVPAEQIFGTGNNHETM